MKKILLFSLLIIFSIFITSCNRGEQKVISCEDIITIYEENGYIVNYHIHKKTESDPDVVCKIQIVDPKNPEKNYIYIEKYVSEEKAKVAAEDNKYNIAVWLIYTLNGETRWLKSEYYKDIHYHTFSKKIIKPLKKLMNS